MVDWFDPCLDFNIYYRVRYLVPSNFDYGTQTFLPIT